MLPGGIANILHRDTIAVIVGSKVFERGEECFASGRVLHVDAGRGELRGAVRPQEIGRAVYSVRIWVREEGLAYECTCPMGEQQQFCKHAVAIALAHLEGERRVAEREFALLRRQVMAVDPMVLVDRLLDRARTDRSLIAMLKQLAQK
ncbi:MAG TPA: SWIM zinc finger family protein [Kofleriaceae bacterium]|nr:SWIM zinc finger family protein [Kofleriaceae bacterium]